MRFESEDPILTAYALGVLDVAEAAEVEARLADDRDAALLVSELRALGEELTTALAAETVTTLEPTQRTAILRDAQTLTSNTEHPTPWTFFRNIVMHRYSRLAACFLVIAAVVTVLVPSPGARAMAQNDIIQVPDGGRLDAFDELGRPIGPCPLSHTDVDVDISGFFSRVTVTQRYENPYDRKIEAVYTFPLSHDAAVDRMTMTVGERVVTGEVKERAAARVLYEAARNQGYVASLLEQERPNIFTQSVANIEPGATVDVEISYVEVLESSDGRYSFDFPMVVGPRYIPGSTTTSPSITPAELTERVGVILLGPAGITLGAVGNVQEHGSLQPAKVTTLLQAARAIDYPGDKWWGKGDATGGAGGPELWYRFESAYCDGSKEFGELYTDGTGQISGRWFYTDPKIAASQATGFAPDTNQVPDASRITPMPVRPEQRAGHDISVTVTIDSGGPKILDIETPLHETTNTAVRQRPGVRHIALRNENDIPNRDFALSWRLEAETITESKLVHTRDTGNGDGSLDGYFTLILEPPARVLDVEVPARELIFVMDTSGSMNGVPIEKSKAVMTRAIDAMRPTDTFNLITFAGHTSILWSKPQPATAANRAAAKTHVEGQSGQGGTEMMKAIEAALVQTVGAGVNRLTIDQLANLPADGRVVEVTLDIERHLMSWPPPNVRSTWSGPALRPSEGTPFQVTGLPAGADSLGRSRLEATGNWVTRNQRRLLLITSFRWEGQQDTAAPMRIVLFLTDGYVGNDQAIIAAVKDNTHTTRVFSFGIGGSVNRYLIDAMAAAGRGESEFVLLEEGDQNANEAVARLTRRIETPVLTDISLEFSDGLSVSDIIPERGAIPDLFDAKPIVIHGRYARAGEGSLTIRGRTGRGAWERTLSLDLAETAPEHDQIATLWARAKVDEVMGHDLLAVQQGRTPGAMRNEIVALGEDYQIMTQFTSFVAVERSRLTIDGKPVLVAVPIEMPQGVSWEGIFGGAVKEAMVTRGIEQLATTTELYRRTQPSSGYLAYSRHREGAQATPGLPGIDTKTGLMINPTVWSTSRGSRIITDVTFRENQVSSESIRVASGTFGGGQFASTAYSLDGSSERGRYDWFAMTLPVSIPNTVVHSTFPASPAPQQAKAMIDTVTNFVAPKHWVANGGDLVNLRWADNAFVIEQVSPEPTSELIARQAAGLLSQVIQATPEAAEEIRRAVPLEQFTDEDVTTDDTSTVILDARDLIGPNLQRAQELIQLIMWAVAPGSWNTNGADASMIRQLAGNIIVKATPARIGRVERLLEVLRLINKEPGGSRPIEDISTQPIRFYNLAVMADFAVSTGAPDTATCVQQVASAVGSIMKPDPATLTVFDRVLAVQASEEIHAEIVKLLDELRASFGLADTDSARQAKRKMRLDAVLDTRLRRFADGEGLPETLLEIYDGPTPADTEWSGGGLLLSILLEEIDEPAIDAFETLGVEVKNRVTLANGSFLVAVVPPGRIADVALTKGVRWVAPTRLREDRR